MATGNQVENDSDPHRLPASPTFDILHQRSLPADRKNMKEVGYLNKEDIDKERFPVGRCVHNHGKVKRAPSRRSRHSAPGVPGARRRAPSAGRPSDMANKENVLGCGEGAHCKERLNPAGAKYADHFTELSEDHDTMSHVLFGRNLRLNVALTLWRRNASELVAYLIRIQDPGVLVDCLPVLTKSLEEEDACLSIGCCVDLLPHVHKILQSRYEEHLTVALHWVQSVIKKWWTELSSKDRSLPDAPSNDKNVQTLRNMLIELWDDGCPLSSVPGTVGELTKAVESYRLQLR